MSPKEKLAGQRVVTAISHPLRIEIQRILFYRIASPIEVARELKEDASNVSYHFKVLAAERCISLVKEERRRGAIEHFYRAAFPAKHDDKSWAVLARAPREEITRLTLQGLFGEAVRALNERTFDESTERHLSWVPMALDEQGFRDLTARQARWLGEVEKIKAENAERLGDHDGERVIGAILGFKTPPGFGLCPGDPGSDMPPKKRQKLSPEEKLAGDRVVTALSHPLRIEIQRILFYRAASPSEVARELKENISVIANHFRVLAAERCILPVKPGQRKNFYRAAFPAKHDDKSWASMARTTREDLTRLTLQGLFGEAVRALNERTFDESTKRHLSWVPMALDEQGFSDLTARQARWLGEVEEIKAENAERLGDHDGERVIGAILGFKTPPGFGS